LYVTVKCVTEVLPC